MTSIEWTDEVWNPTRGCSRVSAGCDNCYAMRQAHRFDNAGGAYEGLTRIGKRGIDWAGVVRLIPEQLEVPLRWRKPRRIFVDSMSDLFHESLNDEAIDQVLSIVGACDDDERGHVFQVLTKRAERMRAYMTTRGRAAWNSCRMNRGAWPARNLWLGVSAEDQETAYERIPHLLNTPAAVRFVSAEPLIGPVDLSIYMASGWTQKPYDDVIDWVIIGSESGPRARQMKLEWARALVEQCTKYGTRCFVKQIANDHDRKGGKPEFWPPGSWPRQFPK